MIRATGKTADGRNFLLLGVDAENVRRLVKGHPITVKAESVEIERDVIIVYGEPLQKIIDEMTAAGVVFEVGVAGMPKGSKS